MMRAMTQHAAGPPDAPVVLKEFGDFECPYCGSAYSQVKEVQARLGDRLRFEFRHFPLEAKHPHARQAAEAAEAAGQQGEFWGMHDALFEHQRALEPADLEGYATGLGLDGARVGAELRDHRHGEAVSADVAEGERAGVSGTPAFFINGERYEGFYDADSLEDALDHAAAKRGG